MGSQPHVLMVPYPAQGHVKPLLKLAYRIADHGIKVTFVNTEFNHERILAATTKENKEQNQIELVTFPDGLEPEDDRKNDFKVLNSLARVMPGHLLNLIDKINHSHVEAKIDFVIADTIILGWIIEGAEKINAKKVAVWLGGPGSMALLLHISKLIQNGVLDDNGNVVNDELIWLTKGIPAWKSSELLWTSQVDAETDRQLFQWLKSVAQTVEHAELILCNTFYELDIPACNLIPQILPIGPLLSRGDPGQSSGSLCFEDSSCLSWLDKHPANSVLYIAFGSTAIFSQHQSNELAIGLALSGRPFLWVVQSKVTKVSKYPEGFLERICHVGKIVEWAPQELVLAHPSIACFLSHCGWNSTMEGVAMGVPFLCWPYFCDQFHNRNYICETWKVVLQLDADENGIISRHEIKTKIENLLSDDGIKANSVKLKEMAKENVDAGGSSFKNFQKLIGHLKV